MRKQRKQKLNDQQHIAQLEGWLAECYRLSGADPDGNEDWRLAPRAVEEVKRMRQELDNSEGELLETRTCIPIT